MRASVIRRTAVAASVGSLALLLAACGGEGKGADKGKESAPATPAAPDAKALSAAELEKLLVTQAELPGHLLKKATAAENLPPESVTTDKAECKPVADAIAFIATGKPGATAKVKVIALPEKDPNASPAENAMKALTQPVTAVTLGSYDGKGAEEAFASLRTAGEKCAGGFTATQGGQKVKISSVAPGKSDASGGDENLGLTVTTEVGGDKAVYGVVVVRKANTLANFSTINLSGALPETPKNVVDAQVKKLG
ncbi:hypothetical protein ABZO31_19920 [Streptomyces sp. HUAS MG47]|uniref:hypothetical protein n=1 Tax=Streptomyces solicamelliae TaxID=3231716 RepID=UPI0038783CB5